MEKKNKEKPAKSNAFLWFSVGAATVFIGISLLGMNTRRPKQEARISEVVDDNAAPQDVVLPASGVVLPMKWNNLGKELVETGVIDEEKFKQIYAFRGGLGSTEKKLLEGSYDGEVVMNSENAGFLLNLLWAFGLANNNPILREGPMTSPDYGGAGNFASTGGWTLAKGSAMEHYSAHTFVALNKKQQELVERVSKNIYRPCCGNSTYFPDCNHGMAMLGLLELMAANGADEDEMYEVALKVNSFWFPDTYLTIAKYEASRGIDWNEVDPKLLLGQTYSSAGGYRKILSAVEPVQSSGGGGCGV